MLGQLRHNALTSRMDPRKLGRTPGRDRSEMYMNPKTARANLEHVGDENYEPRNGTHWHPTTGPCREEAQQTEPETHMSVAFTAPAPIQRLEAASHLRYLPCVIMTATAARISIRARPWRSSFLLPVSSSRML